MTSIAHGSYEPRRVAAAGLEGYDAGAGTGVERPVTVPRQAAAPPIPERDSVQGSVQGPTQASARGEHTHSEAPILRPRPVVQRSSVRGQILDALRTALVSGDLLPGEVYSAPALGDRFGVSATPVREAMQQLALEGAVEVVPNRGFRVVERGARELAELAEIRGLLEAPVILRLARTVPRERWAELRPLAEASVRAAATGCRATYGEADRAFHVALLGFAGNGQLVRLAEDLHRRTQQGHADPAVDAAEHVRLVDALGEGDMERVRVLVGEHFGG